MALYPSLFVAGIRSLRDSSQQIVKCPVDEVSGGQLVNKMPRNGPPRNGRHKNGMGKPPTHFDADQPAVSSERRRPSDIRRRRRRRLGNERKTTTEKEISRAKCPADRSVCEEGYR